VYLRWAATGESSSYRCFGGVGDIQVRARRPRPSTWAVVAEGAMEVGLGKEAVARDGRMQAYLLMLAMGESDSGRGRC
jgi:hypothetical protein